VAVFNGLYALLAATPSITSLLNSANPPSIYLSLAQKGTPAPFLVIHLVDGPPAGATLDGVSSMIEGVFQFDSYANDQLTARKLSQAVRDELKNFQGNPLSDGTVIQFVDVLTDMDDPYEIGGQGYVFRSVLRLQAFYNESGGLI
jgi:hypothetical protein